MKHPVVQLNTVLKPLYFAGYGHFVRTLYIYWKNEIHLQNERQVEIHK